MSTAMTTEEKVKDILETIRPYIQSDGGDVEYRRIEDNVVYIALHGACTGCASSLVTLKAGIERKIVEDCPEIVSVEMED
ncbi:MAG: NifU family protein [Candidatus Sumerlaeia bacterium]|nr:NifU family protein [Candidatus Sumerlaeia bacterium]